MAQRKPAAPTVELTLPELRQECDRCLTWLRTQSEQLTERDLAHVIRELYWLMDLANALEEARTSAASAEDPAA